MGNSVTGATDPTGLDEKELKSSVDEYIKNNELIRTTIDELFNEHTPCWGKELYRQHKTELIEFAETLDPKTIFAGGTVVTAIAGQLVDRGYIDEIPLPDIPLYERQFGDSVKIKQALESTWQLGDAPWELTDDGIISSLSTSLTIDLTDHPRYGRFFNAPISFGIEYGRVNVLQNPDPDTYSLGITIGSDVSF